MGAVANVNADPDTITHANARPDASTAGITHTTARPGASTSAITHASAGPDAGTGRVTHTNARPGDSAAACKLEAAVLRAQTKEALIGLGWKPAIANAAAASSVAALGTATTLDRLIFDALRRCARPTG